MEVLLRDMLITDFDEVYQLWHSTPGMGLSGADSRESIAIFLARNPGLSFVCVYDHRIVGTALCGHDGRRGYLYHVTVEARFRGKGIGKRLVAKCLDGLRDAGIQKCHLFVFAGNQVGATFWTALGWEQRHDIVVFSRGARSGPGPDLALL